MIVLMLFLHLGVRTLIVAPADPASRRWRRLRLALVLRRHAGDHHRRRILVRPRCAGRRAGDSDQHHRHVSDPGHAGSVAERDQPGRTGVRRRHAGRQRGRRAGEHLSPLDQRAKPPFDAAVRGTQEVWGAVLSSTLTTVAVFLPVVFVQEEAGQLFRDIALAISAAVGLSLIVSMTVIPTASRPAVRTGDETGERVTPPTIDRARCRGRQRQRALASATRCGPASRVRKRRSLGKSARLVDRLVDRAGLSTRSSASTAGSSAASMRRLAGDGADWSARRSA